VHGSKEWWCRRHLDYASIAAATGPAHQLRAAAGVQLEGWQRPHLDGLEVQLAQPMSPILRRADYSPSENLAVVRHVNPPSLHHKLPVLLQASRLLVTGPHEHREPAYQSQTYRRVSGWGHLKSESGVDSRIRQKKRAVDWLDEKISDGATIYDECCWYQGRGAAQARWIGQPKKRQLEPLHPPKDAQCAHCECSCKCIGINGVMMTRNSRNPFTFPRYMTLAAHLDSPPSKWPQLYFPCHDRLAAEMGHHKPVQHGETDRKLIPPDYYHSHEDL